MNEAAASSAKFAAASEVAVLKWGRAFHDLYAPLFFVSKGEVALLVRKHYVGRAVPTGTSSLSGRG